MRGFMVRLSDFFFLNARTCPFCKTNEASDLGICPSCRDRLDPLYGHRTLAPDFVCAYPYFYNSSLRKWIARFKFQGERDLGLPLSRLMARDCLSRGLLDGVDLVTWIPSHPVGQRKRGYNPAKILAQALARETGLGARALLVKTRHTKPQSSMTDQGRVENVRDVFALKEGLDLTGASICLVDDIFTSGNTLRQAHQALQKAGPSRICALTLASARGHGQARTRQNP